jgi:hypothetical protein
MSCFLALVWNSWICDAVVITFGQAETYVCDAFLITCCRQLLCYSVLYYNCYYVLFCATYRMASSPIEEVSSGDGYVNVVWDEALIQAHAASLVANHTGAAAPVAPPVAAPVAPPPPPPATPGPMRWSNTSSGFVLRRMAQLLSDGSRLDKVFKDKDVNMVARHLKEFTGEIVSSTRVYNHLRK